ILACHPVAQPTHQRTEQAIADDKGRHQDSTQRVLNAEIRLHRAKYRREDVPIDVIEEVHRAQRCQCPVRTRRWLFGIRIKFLHFASFPRGWRCSPECEQRDCSAIAAPALRRISLVAPRSAWLAHISTPEERLTMATRVHWLGHACLLIESGGKHILIDPFLS